MRSALAGVDPATCVLQQRPVCYSGMTTRHHDDYLDGKIVELHGNMRYLHCSNCHHSSDACARYGKRPSIPAVSVLECAGGREPVRAQVGPELEGTHSVLTFSIAVCASHYTSQLAAGKQLQQAASVMPQRRADIRRLLRPQQECSHALELHSLQRQEPASTQLRT